MSRERIEARFAALKAEGRAAFVAYVMAGDPDAATSLEILKRLPAAGADLIELGFPFSDPVAEGPPIQRAAQRALAAGMTMNGTLQLVRDFRLGDQTTPLILMGYLNLIVSMGFTEFAVAAADAGVDGVIVVDCPAEEADPLADALDAVGLSLIFLTTPTTDEKRLPVVLRRASGFVYYVSVAGVTGVKEADEAVVAPEVARIRAASGMPVAVGCGIRTPVRAASGLPVAVGFGIRTPERAAEVARVADAAVVGSALVDEVAEAVAKNESVTTRVLLKVETLSKAVRFARVGVAV